MDKAGSSPLARIMQISSVRRASGPRWGGQAGCRPDRMLVPWRGCQVNGRVVGGAGEECQRGRRRCDPKLEARAQLHRLDYLMGDGGGVQHPHHQGSFRGGAAVGRDAGSGEEEGSWACSPVRSRGCWRSLRWAAASAPSARVPAGEGQGGQGWGDEGQGGQAGGGRKVQLVSTDQPLPRLCGWSVQEGSMLGLCSLSTCTARSLPTLAGDS